ncbi:MAG: SUMF1/EgtB/PvdO family nonheme iron enzyme [Gemmatimonadota bacterium]
MPSVTVILTVTVCVVVWLGGGCSSTSGPSEGGGDDWPAFVLVPSGSFTMGDGTAYCGADQREVTLTESYYLKQHEVTNQEYLDLVQWALDNGYITATTTSVSDDLDGSTVELLDLDDGHCEIAFSGGVFSLSGGTRGNEPVKEVTWYGAVRYCDWLSLQEDPPLGRAYEHTGNWTCNGGDPYGAEGYRLPTDAEWEYAAQYNDERIYPWGSADPTCSRANYSTTCVGGTCPIRSCPDGESELGLSDMAGNVLEWCNDWWTCDLGVVAETDPVGPGSGAFRVIRGGAWNSSATGLRCASRPMVANPTMSDYSLGFRVARTTSP